ncbi:MAG: hypothetical protein H0V82_07230 [Candidatus Protochlamydia sp.]|nr:hypothetical protein [Candidatus Protochlamydia sp.]
MDWSPIFAKFLGIYLLIIVVIWVARKESFERAIRDVILSDGMFGLSGAFHIIIGLMIAILHPIWTVNWQGLITLIAYTSIVQGVLRLAFPIQSRKNILKSLKKGYWIWIVVAGVLGTILTYSGFTH